MTDRPETFRHRRRRLKITQERLAHVLGVTAMTVHHWERGKPSKGLYERVRVAFMDGKYDDLILEYQTERR